MELPLPDKETHCRPLAALAESEDVFTAWAQTVAHARAKGGEVTATAVQGAAADLERRRNARELLTSSRTPEHYTPVGLVRVVRRLLGGIDLDPASCATANKVVKATVIFTLQHDGLLRRNRWAGPRIFINPPGGVSPEGDSMGGLFLKRAVAERVFNRRLEIVLLLRAAVGYVWFNTVYKHPHCVLYDRPSFTSSTGQEQGKSPHGYVVVYLGARVGEFIRQFRALGHIPGANSWAAHDVG